MSESTVSPKAKKKADTAGQADAAPSKEDLKAEAWVRELAAAAESAAKKDTFDKARSEIIGGATIGFKVLPAQLKGLDFALTMKKNANFATLMLSTVGKTKTMSTLTGTGDAMNEFDTWHDAGRVEPVDEKTLAAAQKSLDVIVSASQRVDQELMALYCAEAGIDPGKIEELQKQLDEKRSKAKDKKEKRKKREGMDVEEETSPDEKELQEKFELIRLRVEKEVRDEVWQPLVRQGLIPENFVPDRHSEVSRTFEAASALYEDRIAQYTDAQGPFANIIAKLGVGKTFYDKSAELAESIVDAVPGSEAVKGTITTGIQCSQIVMDTAFDVTGQILQKADALDIVKTVLNGMTAAVATWDEVPPEVVDCLKEGVTITLTGGKAIKALMDGKPQDALAAMAQGVADSLDLAATLSGNPNVALSAQAVALAISSAGSLKAMVEAYQESPVDKRKLEQALMAALQQGLNDIDFAVDTAVAAEAKQGKLSASQAAAITGAVDISTTGAGDIAVALVSDDKAAGLAAALGKIANSCCTDYIPGGDGAAIGGMLQTAFTGGTAFITAVKNKNAVDALNAFAALSNGVLSGASGLSGLDPNVANALTIAAASVKGGADAIAGAAAFKKAVAAGNLADAQKALTVLMNAVLDPVLTAVDPDALDASSDDDDDDYAGTDDGADAEDDTAADVSVDAQAETATKQEEAYQGKLRKKIADLTAVIKQGKPAEVEKAKADRDAAVKELLERKAFLAEIEADGKDFATMLSSDATADDPSGAGDTRTLEKLIATLQRDRMVLKLIDTMASMTIDVLAKFLPPAGIAADFKKFAVESAKAVAHLRQLLLWKKNAKEARNAVSVQVHAMLNREGLETDAVIEHQIKAALALTAAIGHVVATAGAHAAPAGVAMAASANVARAALDVALTIKSAAEMEIAWSQYKKALETPQDRKAIRMAIEKNATMAKYALVWGALQDGNPIAKKALKRCNLTDAIIAKESANVDKVVNYLEVLYADDPVVVRASPDIDAWSWKPKPPKPEVSLRCWTTFLAIGQTKANPKMMPNTGGAVSAAFGALQPARAELAKAKKVKIKVVKEIKDQIATLQEAATAALSDALKAALPDVAAAAAPAAPSREKVEADIANKAKEDAAMEKQMKRFEAKIAAQAELVATKEAALADVLKNIKSAALQFKPLDEDGEPYEHVAEFLNAIAAKVDIELRGMNKEDVGAAA